MGLVNAQEQPVAKREEEGSEVSTSEEVTQHTTIAEGKDVEKGATITLPDIEHQPVVDDPRLWSPAFKWTLVAILCFGALIPTMAANIFFPVINDLKSDLNASDSEISLSVSLFILAQGTFPLLWSPVSEIVGRKGCFLTAITIFSVSMFILGGATKTVQMLIAFRVIGAAGSAAMLAIAAGTLADLYEPEERGVKVGIYYCSPLIGPALGPIFGGALGETGAGAWRLTFYLMGACGAASFVSFVFFKETFRTERSLAWQKARKVALEKAEAGQGHSEGTLSQWRQSFTSFLHRQSRHTLCLVLRKSNNDAREITTQPEAHAPFVPPEYHQEGSKQVQLSSSTPAPSKEVVLDKGATLSRPTSAWTGAGARPGLVRNVTTRKSINRVITSEGREIKFRPALSDVSPLGSAIAVLKQPHNIVSLLYSGLGFASQYSLSYTAARTFSAAPYNFSPILVGVVLLALGLGGMAGSILGGRLSDRALRRESQRNGGHRAAPELRIMSVRLPMLLCPPAFVGYAWSAEYHSHIAIPVICLIVLGFSLFWIYSSTLSYVVDSNTGRSSGAVACNSALRGIFAFVASEVAGPLQDAVGDGPLYTGWAVLLALGQLGLLAVAYKGEKWRDPEWKWPRLHNFRHSSPPPSTGKE